MWLTRVASLQTLPEPAMANKSSKYSDSQTSMPYALAIQGTCWLERIKEPSPAHTRVTKLLSLKSTYLTAERANDSVLQKFA